MARLEVDLPNNVFERLASECLYSGEPMDSIITRALVMLFSQSLPMENEFLTNRNNVRKD